MKSESIKSILDPYDNLPLECDGFTRIAHYLLSKENIPHECYSGSVTFGELAMCPHYWIIADKFIVDYRLRMWFGTTAPHGVFRQPKNLVYKGIQSYIDCNKFLFKVLTTNDHF